MIIQYVDGKEFANIVEDGIPLGDTPEHEFRKDADAVMDHPFFEGVTVSYQIRDINKHPGSPRNLWADFQVRWK
jgi:hypothetical protein